MITRLRDRSTSILLVAAVFVSLGIADTAFACRWWLPDFDSSCERRARPPGAVMPMSFPYIFEDPYITTSLNLVGAWHDTPPASAFEGEDIGIIALQARVALTNKLAFIATKDGYAWYPETSLLESTSGYYNITLGLKYALIDMLDEHGFILTPSLRYEIAIGRRSLGQGNGDGVIIPAVTAAWKVREVQTIVGLGGQVGFGDHLTDSFFWNLHFDYAFPMEGMVEHIVPFFELNGILFTGGGDGTRPIGLKGGGTITQNTAETVFGPFNGADVVNLGSAGSDGEMLITAAVGLRVPLRNGLSFGVSYERAVSDFDDIFKQRVTGMAMYEF